MKVMIFISNSTQIQSLWNVCSVHPWPPHILSYTINFLTGGTRQKQLACLSVLVIQMWPSFSPGTRSGHVYCLCLLDQTLSLCHVGTVISHFYSYNVHTCLYTVRPKYLVSVNSKLLLIVSGFMGMKLLIVHLFIVQIWNCMGAIH